MDDLISIIVAVYNTEQYLKKCIESILHQTYTNIEIILINDGSTDNSGNICNEYLAKDNRIKVLHKENGGASDARNKGLEIASGQYIGFVDCDDYIEPDFCQTLYDLSKEHDTDVAMVSYNQIKNHISTPRFNSNNLCILEKKDAIEQLLFDETIQNYVWNKLYKVEIFEDIRFPVGIIYDDISAMYKIFKKMNKVAYYEIPKYNYLFRENSIMNKNSHEKLEDGLKAIIDRFHEISEDFPDLETCNSYSLILWIIRIYSFMVKSNDFNDYFLKNQYTLFRNVFEQHKEYIINKLSPKKRIILFLMLWDFDKSRTVLKTLFSMDNE